MIWKNVILTKLVVGVASTFLFSDQPIISFKNGVVEIVNHEDENSSIVNVELNYSVDSNSLLATSKGSRVQLNSTNAIWRLGSLSLARWPNNDSIWIHSGSALYCSTVSKTITFTSRKASAIFTGKGTIIIEALENGGFKFIPIESDGELTTSNGGSIKTIGGRMLLVLGPKSYYGDAYDLDLILLLKSSRLINSFPQPLSTFDQIGLAIYTQELKLKGKYNALIGDAPTKDNLQMWQFGPSEDENNKGFFNKIFKKN